MEYIQCPHCTKKYGVNDRMRGAVGKLIRCKSCQNTFQILIIKIADRTIPPAIEKKLPQQNPQTAKPDSPTPQPKTPDKPSLVVERIKEESVKVPHVKLKKKLDVQFVFLIGLSMAILLIAIGMLIYFKFPQLVNSYTNTKVHQVSSPDSSPIGPPSNSAKQPEPTEVEDTINRHKTMLEGPKDASKICRDVAADFWKRSHTMNADNIDIQTYTRLLNEGVEQPSEIRNLCHDRYLTGRLIESAKQDKIPPWISSEIEAHSDTR
ncbi:MAG: zinc-ribbon domain-containing protein [Mariprofundus sp.]|nr:zinc-ribbon domain-containing protein [Mariprofundus sp.]